jgi:hypothetical protein
VSDLGDNATADPAAGDGQHNGAGRRDRTPQQNPPASAGRPTGSEAPGAPAPGAPAPGAPAPGAPVPGAPARGAPRPATGPGTPTAPAAPNGPKAPAAPGPGAAAASAAAGPTASDSGTAAASPAAAGSPTEDEQAELAKLRAEVEALRKRPPPPPSRRRRRGGWRAPVASLLIVLGCILAPLSVIGVWTANQVSNTNRYVENVAPLIHDPAIQSALTNKITAEITSRVKVQALTNQAADTLSSKGLTRVSTLLHAFSGQLAGAVNGFIHTEVAKIVASQEMANLWVQLNTRVHASLVKALSGQGSGAITTSNGQVVLNLGPAIDLVKTKIAARGLTIVNSIPKINPQFALFSDKYLVKAQSGYRLLNDLKIVLPVLTLLLLGAGIYVARGHRRATVGAGLGLAASMLVLGIALAIGRAIYLNSVPPTVLPSDAAAVLYDTLVRFIKDGLRALLVVGLIVAIAAFFTGPSVAAVRTRHGLARGIGWLRGTGERAGLNTGPVGRWTYRYRTALRISAVALIAIIFVFLGTPSATSAIVLAIVLLVLLGLIELIGRPPARAAQPQAAGPAGG